VPVPLSAIVGLLSVGPPVLKIFRRWRQAEEGKGKGGEGYQRVTEGLIAGGEGYGEGCCLAIVSRV
jgi:hypothetical protein